MKVVDRRRVDETGEERSIQEQEEIEQQAANAAGRAAQTKTTQHNPTSTAQPPKSDPVQPPKANADSGKALPQIDFSTFVQSLGQQALMHLGLIPWPEDGERHREMALAKQTIDILNMLHEKTKGNLSPDEQKLFDALLHDLRLVFIQVKQ